MIGRVKTSPRQAPRIDKEASASAGTTRRRHLRGSEVCDATRPKGMLAMIGGPQQYQGAEHRSDRQQLDNNSSQ